MPTTTWTTADLELFPDDGNRYEIADGELLVTRAPDWRHQRVISRVVRVLETWSEAHPTGEVVPNPGVIFADSANTIPDVVWCRKDTLAYLDDSGHLTTAPDLAIEVLSPGLENIRRDKQVKLKLYSERGVKEYWILDRLAQTLEQYQRDQGALRLTATLFAGDVLKTPLLPEFSCTVAELFPLV